jgi:hypothetical protein
VHVQWRNPNAKFVSQHIEASGEEHARLAIKHSIHLPLRDWDERQEIHWYTPTNETVASIPVQIQHTIYRTMFAKVYFDVPLDKLENAEPRPSVEQE